MTLTFSARIVGTQIHCETGSDTALSVPIFCISLMAAPKVIAGGVLVHRLAGFAEVLLPDIAAGSSHRIVLAYDNPDFQPRNRAWLPLGPDLKTGKTCHPVRPWACCRVQSRSTCPCPPPPCR